MRIKRFNESLDDLSNIQAEYDRLVNSVKNAVQAVNDFESSLESKNLYVDKVKIGRSGTTKGTIKKISETWGVFWRTTYYSHFDGHSSDAIYDDCGGAAELSEESADAIRELITCWDILSWDDKVNKLNLSMNFKSSFYPHQMIEKSMELMDEYGEDELVKKSESTWVYDMLVFTIGETRFRISVGSGERDQGQCVDGSYVEFRMTSDKEIKEVKGYEKERRG